MANRVEFTAKTRDQAHDRAEGRCEWMEAGFRCEAILGPGNCEYDHRIPWAISRDSSLSNCWVLCRAHHALKTARDDAPWIAKTRHQRQAHNGSKVSKYAPIPSRGFVKVKRERSAPTKIASGIPGLARRVATITEDA